MLLRTVCRGTVNSKFRVKSKTLNICELYRVSCSALGMSYRLHTTTGTYYFALDRRTRIGFISLAGLIFSLADVLYLVATVQRVITGVG